MLNGGHYPCIFDTELDPGWEREGGSEGGVTEGGLPFLPTTTRLPTFIPGWAVPLGAPGFEGSGRAEEENQASFIQIIQ